MKVSTAIIVFFTTILISPPALAYLDPSTGSMIITAIVGLFASLVLAVKTYWYKLKSFFRGKSKAQETDEPPPPKAVETERESQG